MQRFQPRSGVANAGIVVLALALLAAAIYIWRIQDDRLDRAQEAEELDTAAVAAAEDQAMAWTTVDYRKINEYVASIKKGAGGGFLTELEKTEKTLKELTVKNKTVQSAEIPPGGAALVERSGDDATVIVAVDTRVTTRTQPKATERQFRLKLTLQRKDSGWLTTGLEFVK